MPTSGNTNLYFEAHKPVFFNKNLYFFKNIHKQASFTSFSGMRTGFKKKKS